MSERPCGIKPTAKNNAYTKNELIKIAQQLGISYDLAKSMSIKELCDLAGIDTSIRVKHTPENECKFTPKNKLIQKYIDKLTNQGISQEQAEEMSKDYLCDIIFDLQANLVVPEDFDEKSCSLYDTDMLKRIARKLGLEYQSSITKEELCRMIRVEYFIKKNDIKFDNSKNAAWKDLAKGDYKCLLPPNEEIKLEKHQEDIARHMLTHRGLIAVHSVGSGKTLSAVTAINCVLGKYPNLKVVIITPLSLKQNFKDEMEKFGLNLDDINVASKVRIFSYEGFAVYFSKHPNECKNTFLIVDEAHNVRSEVKLSTENKIAKGSRAYYIMKCAASAFKVLLLTATPIVNRPFDIRNLIMMVDGIEPEQSKNFKFFKQVLSNKALIEDQLKCKVSVFSIDLKNNPDYPKRIDMPIEYITMDSDYYNKYRQIELNQMENSHYIDLVGNSEMFYTSLRRSVNALDAEFSPKVNAIVDFILNEAKAGRKSVVYSNWKAAGMNLLRKRLDQKGIKNLYGYISGDLTEDQRKLFKDKINSGVTKILLISKAGGEGLNLKEIRNVILMESNWNAAMDEQIIGRAIRKFSHKNLPIEDQNVRVYRYIMKKPASMVSPDELRSIDEVLYELAYEKKQPIINEFIEIMKDASIEKNNCGCANDSGIGCETSGLAERIKKEKTPEEKQREEEEKQKRKEELDKIISDSKFIYTAPDNMTSLALDITEAGMATFKKLSGIKGDVIRRRQLEIEDSDDEEEKFEEIKLKQPKKRKHVWDDEEDSYIEGNSPALDPDEEELDENENIEAELIESSQEAALEDSEEESYTIKSKKKPKKEEDESYTIKSKKKPKKEEDESYTIKSKKKPKKEEDESYTIKSKKKPKKSKYDFEEEERKEKEERKRNIEEMEKALDELGGPVPEEELRDYLNQFASESESEIDIDEYIRQAEKEFESESESDRSEVKVDSGSDSEYAELEDEDD
uniref:Helicase ATP-binding domain-containing protein n=1 Tax=viral metagenome TaxID=1070528 RepID=A0A6C0HEJ2_9ZZZZ